MKAPDCDETVSASADFINRAAARLDAQRQTLVDNFPEASRYRRKLACLDAGDTDAACWR